LPILDPVSPVPSDLEKLALREKLAYGLGDSAANFVGATQATFLLYFYTDVLGITAQAAGSILLVTRLVDALNDPIMGALADRTRTRWGRYRPWILWTAVPLAVALVLCFTTPDWGATGKIVWAVVTYNLLMVTYAANNIPYCALSGVMTGDGDERTNLASWRFLFAMGATLLVTAFTVDMVEYFGGGDAALGYQDTMMVWAVAIVLCFAATFALTRERVHPMAARPSSVRQDLSDLFHNGPWLALFSAALLIYVQLAFRSGTMLYYFQHYQRAPQLVSRITNFGLFNGVGLAVVMVGVFLSNPLSRRFGKRRTFQACLLISALLMAAFISLPRDSTWGLFTLQILMQLAFGPTIPLLWAMMADVADYTEWKTGRQSTALAFASIVFGFKLGSGLGGWINGELLQIAGYVGQGEPSEESLRTIALLVSVLPAAALMMAAAVLFFYGIDRQLAQEIEATLHQRRQELQNASATEGG
jgi:glycoside/pentoside/hexuronide:cation symporter, GPH family